MNRRRVPDAPDRPECPDCGSQVYTLVRMKHPYVRLECDSCRTTFTVLADHLPPEEYER